MTAGVTEGEGGFPSFVMRVRALGASDSTVLRAIEEASRPDYVPRELRAHAHADWMFALPCGQATERLDDAVTLLEAARIEPHHRVLEIGTGGGFLTEVLSRLARRVVTVDRYRSLLSLARERHARRGRDNIVYLQRDAAALPDLDGPFDRIVSSVAFGEAPRAFIEHLVAEGVLAAPIGPAKGPQTVMRLAKVGARFERTPVREGWFPPVQKGVAHAL